MKGTAKRHKEIKEMYDKWEERMMNKEANVDLYATFYDGFKAGYNYRKREERE